MLRQLSNWESLTCPSALKLDIRIPVFILALMLKQNQICNSARNQTIRNEDIVKQKDIIVGHPVRLNSLH